MIPSNSEGKYRSDSRQVLLREAELFSQLNGAAWTSHEEQGFLTGANHMNMCWLVIAIVNHDAEAVKLQYRRQGLCGYTIATAQLILKRLQYIDSNNIRYTTTEDQRIDNRT
jgi:hypothetical protein